MSSNFRSNSAKWKGKQRARDDGGLGNGGPDGILLPLDYVQGSAYDAAYSVPLLIGSQQQKLSLQVDTGSSDLWIASTSCSSDVCSYPGKGGLYDPTSSTDAINTGVDFTINYLAGKVEGDIYWDRVEAGGYVISNQALAAAADVENEPLSPLFSGVLGLALPANSIIATNIQPTTSNDPDGAVWSSNLFSITPGTDPTDFSLAPSKKFLSITLSRPGSSKIPSLLGIGRHPSGHLTLPDSLGGSSATIGGAAVNYHRPLESLNEQELFWKVAVTSVSVWVNSVEMPVALTQTSGVAGGVAGGPGLTAVLDTGLPVIIMSSAMTNGIYGALGIGPASDGNYYIPCSTPLNLSITIASTRSTTKGPVASTSVVNVPYSVHPLDLSDSGSNGPSDSCISLIQANDGGLARAGAADMILGIPFLRGVYFVMGYQDPSSDGSFPPTNTTQAVPFVGLQTLLDPTNSLDEFRRVRVLNQPIDPEASCSGPDCTGGKSKVNVGIKVLIGIGSLAAAIALIGLVFWIFARLRARKRERERGDFTGIPTADTTLKDVSKDPAVAGGLALWLKGLRNKEKAGDYQLATLHNRSPSAGTLNGGDLSEDELRRMRYEKYMQAKGGSLGGDETLTNKPPAVFIGKHEQSTTMSSGVTRIGDSSPMDREDEQWGWKNGPGKADNGLGTVKAADSTSDLDVPKIPMPPAQPTLAVNRNLSPIPGSTNEDRLEYMSTPSSSQFPTGPHISTSSLERPPPAVMIPSSPISPSTASPLSRSNSTSLVPSSSLRAVRPGMPPRNVVSDYEPFSSEFGEHIGGGMAGVGTAARSKRDQGHDRFEVFNFQMAKSSSSPIAQPEPSAENPRKSDDSLTRRIPSGPREPR
ncbi:aspartic peptidase domain-containing protein [Mycena floridula]|nr:aspartic peptidase domain-containing protein [Mycena floridula]